MANTLARFKKYTDKLDEVYQHASVTAVLDGDGSLVQMGANAGEMIIPKINMDGLADYSRSGGYVAGDVTLTNETVHFNYDRGRVFTVDAMDDEETAGAWRANLSARRLRRKWTHSALQRMHLTAESGKKRRICPAETAR